MKPYLIAIDLDGTLLKDNKTISDRTFQTIKHLQKLGHFIMIATGRPFPASYMYYKQLMLNTPIVNYNGAYVHHPMNQSSWETFHSPIPLSAAEQIINMCDKYNIKNIMAQVKDNVFLQNYDEAIMEFVSFGNPTIKIGEVKKNLNSDPTAILIHSNKEEIDHIRQHLSAEVGLVIEHRTSGGPLYIIEIIKEGINKGKGVKMVADYYQIPYNRIIAFGDEDNDLEMLKFATHGIAMGNAIDKLKLVAHEITCTNEEDGVAVFLEKFFSL